VDGVTRVLAIRHGETAWNVGSRIQGQLDIPLNAVGEWQVNQLAEAISHEGITAIYSSDLSRAFMTAQAVSRGAGGVPVITDKGLRERAFGVFEGLTYDEITLRWPEQGMRWRKRDASFGAEGGETLADFYARSIETAKRLCALHPDETIALVSHGGVMDCLYRAASRIALDAPRSWRVDNASINRLLYTPEGFTLVGWADIHHLEGRALDEPGDALDAERAA
jgi:2,3-bisphosphoglycerate-dependent phosphoglycerate mutase